MDKIKHERKSFEVPCALHGTKTCPRPQDCNGVNRLCSKWENHSGR